MQQHCPTHCVKQAGGNQGLIMRELCGVIDEGQEVTHRGELLDRVRGLQSKYHGSKSKSHSNYAPFVL